MSVWFLALCLGFSVQAASVAVNVVDGAGNPVADHGFKYMLQEDTTFAVDPANPPAREDMLSFGFHASNHPMAIDTAGNGITGHWWWSNRRIVGREARQVLRLSAAGPDR